MAEVKWQARRVDDGVLVDVTADTDGTPAAAPTPNALEAGGGEGGASVLEDPVNVWEPDTAVAEGYRIGVANGGHTEVMEVEVAGTTPPAANEPTIFPNDPSDNFVLWNFGGGSTTEWPGTVVWRHIGRVGEIPIANAYGVDEADAGATFTSSGYNGSYQFGLGHLHVVTGVPHFDGEPYLLKLSRLNAAGDVQTVFWVHQTGDADWILSEGSILFRTREGTNLFRLDHSEVIQLHAGDLVFNNLPTANPNVAGQLWNDAGTLKVSAG